MCRKSTKDENIKFKFETKRNWLFKFHFVHILNPFYVGSNVELSLL